MMHGQCELSTLELAPRFKERAITAKEISSTLISDLITSHLGNEDYFKAAGENVYKSKLQLINSGPVWLPYRLHNGLWAEY
jgi:hypothetical protein